ncbi:acyltransferase family protein [Enterobacter pseudoroggenkampii]|uniref:acyltransferase family protein n=1 Tax=Enterobacter pseudoroggenkampii TaxID=2996112 RepID=UPI0025B1F295|nr:acyltransferase family protein [Enterobacter pseudoroggenkampii]WJW93192.1 acyltransferase family protein [Enterobacter pseudoroggenkampii]
MLINSQDRQSIDTIKGMLIFLVVFGHMLESNLNNEYFKYTYSFIYTFHMPLFIFTSGFLSKGIKNVDIGKLIKGIILPLIIFNAIYEGVNLFKNGSFSGYFHLAAPYWLMWYLLSLLFWKLISPFILSTRHPLVVAIATSLLFQHLEFNGLSFSAMRTFTFLPFYIMGCLAFKHSLHLKRPPISITLITFITSLAFLALVAKSTPIPFLYGSSGFNSLGLTNFQFLAYRLLSYLGVVLLIASMFYLHPSLSFLSRLGGYSLSIYLIHGLFIRELSAFLVINIPQSILLPTLMIVCCTVCFLLSFSSISELLKAIFDKAFSLIFKSENTAK